ncbi:MAG: type IV toxin-antitoxin system AbiEi family antitoxin domain-containing protein [Propionibacteriaceae bacterium]|nr:type IV toxin-antitoxin system AbiEi family antitoxin domain-containing protein [Propionibacteriaceae bacterium]
MTIREDLWEVALDQYGYVTSSDAARLGLPKIELTKLANRGKLRHVFQGVYRFPEFRVSLNDQLIEAVLWTRDPLAVLSHETALEVRELSDVNPNVIHVTVPKRKNPIRRKDMPEVFVIHYEDLTPRQRDWWEEIPCVTVETAIDQSIISLPRPDLVTQAIDQAEARGLITKDTARRQRHDLRERYS